MSENNFDEKTKDQKKQLLIYQLLHFLNDLHATVLPNVLPILKQALSLSLAQLGILNAAFGVMHFIGQPIAGAIADKQTKPWFAVWGPMICVISLFLLPSSPHFAFAILFCVMLGFGTALFHPQGNGITGKIAMGKNMAFHLACFIAAGSFGSAFGPMLFVFWFNLLGKYRLHLMTIPFFIIFLFIWKFLSKYQLEVSNTEPLSFNKIFSDIKEVFVKIFDIFAIVSLRDVVFQGIKVFLPMLIIMRGGNHSSAAVIIFCVTISVAIANIIGGKLASVFSQKKLLMVTLALAPFAGIAGIYFKNFFGIMMLMLLFGLLESSASATTSMAQRRCPEKMSTAASISTGASWGVANLAAYPVGAIADKIGLEPTMYCITIIPWFIIAWYLAKKISHRGAEL